MTLIEEAISFAKQHLPAQGPLEYFVHHNTLHSLEGYNFFEALKIARNIYGAKTNKQMKWYQEQFRKGRITEVDLQKSFERIFPTVDYQMVKEKQLLFWNEDYTPNKDSLAANKFANNQKLLSSKLEEHFQQVSSFWSFIDDHLFTTNQKESSEKTLFKFFAAYFDKGVAYWQMEDRQLGLLACFEDYAASLFPMGANRYLKQLLKQAKELGVKRTIEALLTQLCPNDQFWKNYLFQALYQYKGWTALALTLESKELYNPTQIKVAFDEYIIIVLLMELANLKHAKARKKLNDFDNQIIPIQNNFDTSYLNYVFHHSQKDQVVSSEVVNFVEKINYDLYLQLWFEAYEEHLIQSLNPYLVGANAKSPIQNNQAQKKLQVIVCIDDREESLRRHYEESSPEVETFGYAGHFGLNIQFKGLNDAHYRPLCPVSVIPQHFVWEESVEDHKNTTLGSLKHFFFHNSKLPLFGTLAALFFAPINLLLFLTTIVFPKHSQQLEAKLKKQYKTKLNYLACEDREKKGYTYEELADSLYAMLKTIGLTKNFANMVYVCGHGSESTNNPHKAAYDCGACGGGRGIPNARLMTLAGNDPNIRDLLKEKGVEIPDATTFVAGYHNTANDDLLILDPENYPKEKIQWLQQINTKVAALDAKERVRKFEDVPLKISPSAAFKHVQNRIFDYSQARAEYGHSTNSVCIVGDRELSKDIFFDRRAFLVSYDAKADQDASVINALMASIVPVCAGINLEYYFSYVDPEVFGSGNKQPHNITSLMGVMNGYKSDLRLGLPWQMVEIHEPMRILIYVESQLEVIQKALETNQGARNLVHNQWVRLIVMSPDQKLYNATETGFEELVTLDQGNINQTTSSIEFCQNKREVVNFAKLVYGAKK